MAKPTRVVFGLWVSLGAGGLISLGSAVLLARVLDVAEFGVVSACVALLGILAPVVSMGVGQTWLRLHGEEGPGFARWVPAGLMVVAAGTAAVVVAGVAARLLFGGRVADIFPFFLPLVAAAGLQRLVEARWQIENRYGRLSRAQLVLPVTRLAWALLAVAGAWRLGEVGWAVLVAGLIVSAWWVATIAPMHRAVPPGPRPRAGAMFGRSLPFAVGSMLFLVLYQSDQLLVAAISGEHEAGLYGAAFTIAMGVYLLPRAAFQGYLQRHYHVWAYSDRDRLRRTYRTAARSGLLLGAAIGGTLAALSPWLVPTLFGSEFEAAVGPTVVLMAAVPLRFINGNSGAVLSTRDNIRHKVRWTGLAAVFNVGVNLAVIPRWGATGAAVTTVFTEALLCLTYWRLVVSDLASDAPPSGEGSDIDLGA